MRAFVRMAAALAVGALLSAAGTTEVRAQSATAPGYVILEFTVKDADGFKEYAQRAPATVQQYGGKFLVRPGEIVGLKGDAPSGPFAVIAFDSVEDAQAWASSPEYTAIVPMRDEAADLRAFIVEGVAP